MKTNNKYDILTPYGWCDFAGVQKNKKDVLYKIKCGNDHITATRGHIFFVNGDEVKVENLQIGDVIDGCKNKIDSIKIDREDNTYDIVDVKNDKHKFVVNGKFHSRNCDEYAFIEKRVASDFWASNFPTISASSESKIVIISCVTNDTYVYTDKGIKQIKDFIIKNKKGGYIVNDYSILGRNKLYSGNLIVNSGRAKTRILKTYSSELEGSLNHKLWACKKGDYNWYKLSELEVGDYVALQLGMNVWGSNDGNINQDWAYLIGLYITAGDGLCISTGDDVSQIFKNLNIDYKMIPSLNRINYYMEIMPEILNDLNIKKHNIPKKLMEMSRDNIVSMLRGILDAGSVFNKGNVIIESHSKDFLWQIKILLMNLGIIASIYPYKNAYRLHCRYNDSRKVYEIIGYNVIRKQKQMFKLPTLVLPARRDCIPFINKVMTDEIHNELFGYVFLFKHAIRSRMLEKKDQLKQYKEFDGIIENIDEHIRWDKITKITESENEVFDFSLPEIPGDKWCHSVCYNGIIGHQTPNGMYNMFHKLYSDAEAGRNTFVPLKFTWKDVPGRNDRWAKVQLKNLGKRKFAQEQMVEFLGSASTVIDAEALFKLNSNIVNPFSMSLNDSLSIYELPQENSQYVMGCLPPDEKVLTSNGIKSIIDVSINDKLYDENGNETKIKNIQIYKNFEGYVYDVETYGSARTTKFTDEHPLLVSHQPKEMKRMGNHPLYGNNRYRDFDFKYTEVKDVNVNDWVCFPNMYRKTLHFNYLDNKWNEYKNITRKDFEIDNNPLKDKDFWWFIGIWLGDGWIEHRKHRYSIHTCHDLTKELKYVEKIKSIISKYNRKISIVNKGKNNTIGTIFNSKQIYHFLLDNFGKYTHGKYIPEWVKYIPNEYKMELIRGYIDSGGYVSFKNDRCGISIVSVSLELLEGIQDILYSLGYLPTIKVLRKEDVHPIRGKYCKIKKTYVLSLYNNDSVNLLNKLKYENFDITKNRILKNRNKRYCYFSDDKKQIYIKIKNITKIPYKGDVYNFETISHSYLCRNLVTHNCDISKGTGENASCIQVIKITSTSPVKMEQVAVYHNNKIDVYSFADIINRLSIYYNNAYIMCENNAEGSAVVSRLWWDHENMNLVNNNEKNKNELGIRATKQTKPKAVLLMKKLIEDGDLLIRDETTIAELSTFTEEGGKFTGKDNNDDTVSALYWAVYILEMNILDEYKLLTMEDRSVGQENDVWGILSDVNILDGIDDEEWIEMFNF